LNSYNKNSNNNDEQDTVAAELTDAIFMCPAKQCTAKLSFQDFFAEECCEAPKRNRLLV
jgi:hypothetical protein